MARDDDRDDALKTLDPGFMFPRISWQKNLCQTRKSPKLYVY
jgi:hypothetical protein